MDIAEYTNSGAELAEREREELISFLKEIHLDLAKFCKAVFPERFRKEFTKEHLKICRLFDERAPFTVANCFRGFGKTSLVNLGVMGRDILFRDSRFIPYVSKVATYAESQTENLRMALVASPVIRELFGGIRSRKFKEIDESWSKKTWIASLPDDDDFRTCILPRGAGQQVRGLLYIHWRPDLYQVDDLEDDEEIDSKNYRMKIKDWFYGPLMESVNQAEEDGINPRIIYTDTLKHPDSLLVELLNSKVWNSYKVALAREVVDIELDENGKEITRTTTYRSNVPEFISDKKVAEIVAKHREAHTMDVFSREFQGEPIAKETAIFKPDYFQYYSEFDRAFIERRPYLRNVVIVDPARTVNKRSAETGFVCWGIDVETNKMYLREAIGKKLDPEKIFDESFSMCKRFNALILGVEITGGNEWISQPFRNNMTARGLHFELLELKAPRKTGRNEMKGEESIKALRVGEMESLYRQGAVYHNQNGCLDYEQQLLAFPRPKRWDVIDAASYIIKIQEDFSWYFEFSGGEEIYENEGEYDDILEYGDKEDNLAEEFML